MANLFFRTSVAPYRIDTYNALHDKLGCEFYFLYNEDRSQKFDMQALYDQCTFKPRFLKTISVITDNQKICTNIWQILRKEKPEIVIVPEFKILVVQVLIYKWLFRKKFKVISMCDDSWDMVAHDHEWSKAHKIMRKILTPHLDDLLLLDDRMMSWYQKNYGKGIFLPILRDEKREQTGYTRTLPISKQYIEKYNLQHKKILLFVGRLDPVKNLDRMIDSIGKTMEDFTTIVVGSGILEDSLKKHVSKINKPIMFVGRFEGDAVRAWYNVADAFILPSYMEAFGAVANEALVAGCECIISENAGSSCLINGTNGRIFNPYDIDEMAKAIDETMAGVEPRMEIASRPLKMPFKFDDVMDRVIQEIKTI